MRRVEVKLDRYKSTRIEGPTIVERLDEHAQKSVDEWSSLTVKNMFEAAERALDEQERVAN